MRDRFIVILGLLCVIGAGCQIGVAGEIAAEDPTMIDDLNRDSSEDIRLPASGGQECSRDIEGNIIECPDVCGDDQCGLSEDCGSCEDDCGACEAATFCGDGLCQAQEAESCQTCPGDCGACPEEQFCGDGLCSDESSETCENCPGDCGACNEPLYCGDGQCSSPEEDCASCNVDCGACPAEAICGNGILDEGEFCDDSNQVSGDGCSAGCQVEETEEGAPQCSATYGIPVSGDARIGNDPYTGHPIASVLQGQHAVFDLGQLVPAGEVIEYAAYLDINSSAVNIRHSFAEVEDVYLQQHEQVANLRQTVENRTIRTSLVLPIATRFIRFEPLDGETRLRRVATCGADVNICGDGIVEGDEECDDNHTDGDGCSHTCQVEENIVGECVPSYGQVMREQVLNDATAANQVDGDFARVNPIGSAVDFDLGRAVPAGTQIDVVYDAPVVPQTNRSDMSILDAGPLAPSMLSPDFQVVVNAPVGDPNTSRQVYTYTTTRTIRYVRIQDSGAEFLDIDGVAICGASI